MSQLRVPALSNIVQFLLFAGVAIVAVIVAALISVWVPNEKARSMLVITALILVFTLVGAGKLTGHDLLTWLGQLLGLGKS